MHLLRIIVIIETHKLFNFVGSSPKPYSDLYENKRFELKNKLICNE